MKSRAAKRRRPPIGSPEGIAAYARERERRERNLTLKVRAWARTWEGCRLPGCRRNRRCLRLDACRGVSDEPLSEETLALIRTAIEEMKAGRGGPKAK